MVTAHVIVWLFFLVTGLSVWLYDTYGTKKDTLYLVLYVAFIISLYGIALSIIALIIKLLMVMVGL